MSLNVLGMLYNALLGLGIMIDVNVLNCVSQCSKLIYTLAIFMMLLRYDKCFMISLRNSLSGPGVESLLYLWIDNKNSSFEKDDHLVEILSGISSNNEMLTC